MDVIVRGAEVFTGEGPGQQLDVAFRGDRIAAVAPEIAGEAAEVIDARGLMLCPGFIDMHTHSALEAFHDPRLEAKIAQGFTCEVINPDGFGPAPVTDARVAERRAYLRPLEGPGPAEWRWRTLDEYHAALEQARPSSNLVPSIGHNAVRDCVMGGADRPATAGEIKAMRREIAKGLAAGARTFSLGLVYLPGVFSETEELIELAREAAPYGAPLAVHIRNEGAGVLEAAGEMIRVARESGAPLHISHLKVIGRPELIEPLLALIDEAGRDIDISFDQYPYTAGSTQLMALLPAWAQAGDSETVLARLADRQTRDAIATDLMEGLPGWESVYRACGPEAIYVANAAAERAEVIGRSLQEVAEEEGMSPIDTLFGILRDTRLDATMVNHYTTEEAVREVFKHPRQLIGSDGIFGERPHPRLYGTAARALGRYALREGLVPVHEVVARLTARAADRLELRDVGRLRVGLRADAVLLDPETYLDTATYDDPKRTPTGVVRVFVGGRTCWANGAHTGAREGVMVRTPRTRT
ncbi:MAG: amidohydrolase family protein [Gemmatimonadota bacterium]|nr:MAG: amidohydrolase family protein [Gemmatimonadota bacterium]